MSERTASAEGVRRAAERIKGEAVLTPLLENETLNARVGARVFLKAETLQHCGSFKFRGAYNRLSQLSEAERARGVVAWSSGNHAQGIALAARRLGMAATIIMPADAPAVKAERVRDYGATIVQYDRYTEDREEIAYKLVEEKGATLVPSYDDPDIIEGQGTLALEAVAQARAAGAELDFFVTCCGGGGMTSGCALALEDVSPGTALWIAEPEGFDDAWRSIEAGERVMADVSQRTICDAIATPAPGRLTLPIMAQRVRGGAALAEAEVKAAMAFAFKYLKLVVEPGGAVALAAVLTGKIRVEGGAVGLTLSGGNVDAALFAEILGSHG